MIQVENTRYNVSAPYFKNCFIKCYNINMIITLD